MKCQTSLSLRYDKKVQNMFRISFVAICLATLRVKAYFLVRSFFFLMQSANRLLFSVAKINDSVLFCGKIHVKPVSRNKKRCNCSFVLLNSIAVSCS